MLLPFCDWDAIEIFHSMLNVPLSLEYLKKVADLYRLPVLMLHRLVDRCAFWVCWVLALICERSQLLCIELPLSRPHILFFTWVGLLDNDTCHLIWQCVIFVCTYQWLRARDHPGSSTFCVVYLYMCHCLYVDLVSVWHIWGLVLFFMLVCWCLLCTLFHHIHPLEQVELGLAYFPCDGD